MAGDLDDLPGRVSAATADLAAVADTFPAQAAELILERTDPPRRTGALASTGRVVVDAVVFGSELVDYAAPVHAANPFVDRATVAAEADVGALFETTTGDALAGI